MLVQCTCSFCGSAFSRDPSSIAKSGKTFCSRACANNGARTSIERICQVCGIAFMAWPSQLRYGGKYCADPCRIIGYRKMKAEETLSRPRVCYRCKIGIERIKGVSLCQPCRKADAHERYLKNREQRAEKAKKWREDHPDLVAQYSADWYRKHPEKAAGSARRWIEQNPERVLLVRRAGHVIKNEIRQGRMVRGTVCEECNATDKKIEAAHRDYSVPLDVRWLCISCHRRWDKQTPKTK